MADALRQLRARVQTGKLVLTLEVAPFEQEPDKNLTLAVGHGTVREVLQRLIALDPRYTYRIVGSEIVHVFPAAASKDPRDLLNIKVKSFSISQTNFDLLLKYPHHYIPELAAELARRSKTGESVGHTMGNVDVPRVSIHLEHTSVRDILNEVARRAAAVSKSQQIPTGWVYTFRVDKSIPLGGHPFWELL